MSLNTTIRKSGCETRSSRTGQSTASEAYRYICATKVDNINWTYLHALRMAHVTTEHSEGEEE